MIQLREYQDDCIDRTRQALSRSRSVLLQCPTGSGKTAMAAAMTAAKPGTRTVFSCHRSELIRQTALAFGKVGLVPGFIAPEYKKRPALDVQIGKIQSISRRIDSLKAPDLLIIDEAHHVAASGWARVVKAWPQTYVVGLTATPQRLDGRGLGEWFDEMVLGPSVSELMELGFLSQYILYAPGAPDLGDVKTAGGDWERKGMAAAMRRPSLIGDIVDHWHEYARGKKTLCFCASIDHSKEVAAAFVEAGVRAVHLDGETNWKIRRRDLLRFAKVSYFT